MSDLLVSTMHAEMFRGDTSGTYFELHFFLRFTYFLERGREREKEGEKHQCVVASCTPPTGDLAGNPGMWPDCESNPPPLGSQAGTQSTETQ